MLIPALLIVTSQFGDVIHRKPYPSMEKCLVAKAAITAQGQTPHPQGGVFQGVVFKDRNAPRAVCVPR